MKQALLLLLLFFSLSVFSQDYTVQWEKVMEHEAEGEIKSADSITEAIYNLAKKDKNEPQLLKAFFFRSKYLQVLDEEAQVKIVSNLQAEIKTVTAPTKAIMESLYAGMLQDIYDRNKYVINQRTPVADSGENAFLTWTAKDFERETEAAYLRSIENRELLYNTPLEKYSAVFEFNPTSGRVKRSLYDFLTEQYVTSFKGHYNSYRSPKELIAQINLLLGTDTEFANFRMPDSLEAKAKQRLELFKELEKYYRIKNDEDHLHRTILLRLNHIRNRISYVSPTRQITLATLEKLVDKWNDNLYAYRAKLETAQIHKELADKKEHPDYLIKAVNFCNDIISNSRCNDVAPQALQLKNTIVNQRAHLTLERNVLPGKPILALVNFKNIDTLHLRVYKTSHETLGDIKQYSDKIKGQIPFVQKTYLLPKKNDFFEYSTEIIVPPLEAGVYIVAICSNKAGNKYLGYTSIQATQIALLEQEDRNTTHYQVLDRETGKPVKNAKIMVNRKKQQLNKSGYFSLSAKKKDKKEKHKDILIMHKGDTLSSTYSNQYSYYYEDEDDEDLSAVAQLFLDRAIYRPGQTMHFKGILIQNKKGRASTVPNLFVNVTISDPSGNELKEFRLKTNEFGSFTGSYILPKNGITGSFRIEANKDYDYEEDDYPFWDNVGFEPGNAYFSVEDYKRPTFTVNFEPVKDDIRVNEEVIIAGNAKSFNGVPVQSAKVKYRVTRSSFMSRYTFYGNSGNKDIASGEITTDGEGGFKISFIALPDTEFDAAGLPIFTYTVYADVTDITGETRSGTGSTRAGYHSLALSASVPKIINPKDKNTININSANLNGEFIPATGQVKIYKIAGTERVLKNRPWNSPELQAITEVEFIKNFPHLPYKSTPDNHAYEKMVLSREVTTDFDKSIALEDFTDWPSGNYEFVFSATDSGGNLIETNQSFSLQRDTDLLLPDNEIILHQIVKTDYLKDGYVSVELQSSLPLLYINIMAYDGVKYYKATTELTGGKKIVKIPINRKRKGELSVVIDFIWQNQLFRRDFFVGLASDENSLILESETLKNNLIPGGKESWSFSVKGDKQAAELLASMYDASLDEFNKEAWRFDDNLNRTRNYLENRSMFENNRSYVFFDNFPERNTHSANSYESRLNTFGFNINRSKNIYMFSRPKNIAENGPIKTGVVVDESGMPIPGVNVMIEGTSRGVQTDFDGLYTIAVGKGDILVFSFVGMKTQFLPAEEQMLIIMVDDALHLGYVIVEGYRTTTRATSNVAVTTVTSQTIEGRPDADFIETLQGQVPGLSISSGSGQPGAASTIILRGYGSINGSVEPLYIIDGVPLNADNFRSINPDDISSLSVLKDAAATSVYGNRGANGVIIIKTKQAEKELEAMQQVQARRNFDETAFFYPQLKTDKDGKVSFTFTTPEALTEWKLRLLAHNKKAASGYFENTFITQKDLMVVPNMPRFLREKDTIILTAKITNLTAEAKTGNALLQLFDAVTMQPMDSKMMNTENLKPFSLAAKGSTTVSWKITVPEGLQGLQYKVLAKAGDFTDGEENILPVLTNSMLVTESLPLWVRENTTKTYTLKNLKNNNSGTLRHHRITLEYTTNPVWAALQSLPYLMEYEHNCAEQVFSRYYANAIAIHVLDSNPEIEEVFKAWRKEGKPLSKLEQNEELKSMIMSESPWLMDTQSEEEKKNRMALLFDLANMKGALEANLINLEQKQAVSGGFTWFDGGKENEYITRHILAGFGHLDKLGVKPGNVPKVNNLIKKGITYIDSGFLQNYKKQQDSKVNAITTGYSDLHYLYTRSFYLQKHAPSDSLKKIIDKHLVDAKQEWLRYSLYEKGMAALTLHRFGDTITAKKILVNLRETSATNEEYGMYWIENKAGWHWYRAPIETQALLIEAFTEIDNDTKAADAMKVWLLKHKQNKNWPTTKATTEAVYALLMQGSDWLSIKDNTVIQLGGKPLPADKLAANEKEAGTGYIKLEWEPAEISNGMATLSIENKSAVPGYGGFYWQYFEELDKIQPSQEGIMNISKELYLKKNSANGPELQRITSGNPLTVGDLVTVRLILDIKEDVEYVHLKDLRAAAFEPVDVLSGYHWKEGLGFYKSTRDAATHFFFDRIDRGTYVLEYDLRVNNPGEFSNGTTTIQSMYAPEFSGHTKGIRIAVD